MAEQLSRADFYDGGDGAGLYWHDFQRTVQYWSVCQMRATTVREAAIALNVSDALIREAVNDHYWMFLTGPDDDPTKQIIEHEGQ